MSHGYQGPPVIRLPGQAPPPRSFGALPSVPSAPGASPYSQMGFSNVPPTSFGMPQPYSQTSSPYPIQSAQSNYPAQQMPYPAQSVSMPMSMPMSTLCYPPNAQPIQSMQSCYSQQQNYDVYPNLQKAPDAREYFSNKPPSPCYPGPSACASNPNLYRGESYTGGQMVAPMYSYTTKSPTALPSYNTTPSPRKDQFWSKTSPTVVPYGGFNARADAEILRKAMKGFGTDEKAIIQVLTNRSNQQRLEIESQFKTLYGKDLIKDLKSELSGNFEKLVLVLMMPLPQYYAKELHDAISGIGTDECVLIEILCTMSNHEISVIKQAYEAMYKRILEDDLISDTSGNFKRLMVSLCCANRDESFNVDPAAAMEDARQLLQAGELRFGTDESTFNAILVQRNMAQLKQVFVEYQKITGHDIENAIENEFSGDIKKGLLAIVKCVKNRPGFFAEQLYKSMKGLGTDDNRLIRLVVTRCEVDMGEIKSVFVQQYGESLEDFISGDCSGHYKKCLLALIS